MQTKTENGRLKTRLTEDELREDIERLAKKRYQPKPFIELCERGIEKCRCYEIHYDEPQH